MAHPTDEEDEQGQKTQEELDVDFEPDAELANAVSGRSGRGTNDRNDKRSDDERKGGRGEKSG